jgi:N-acetylglutamate synthase/N-acetylornithine aminotransferase
MSSSKLTNSLDRNLHTFSSFSTLSVTKTRSTNDLILLVDNTNNQRSQLKTLISYIMPTFYDISKSLVEDIYHYECIHLEDLASLLRLNSEDVFFVYPTVET